MKPYLVIKRILDFVISLIVLIILSPFFLVIAILIKLDSKGPVFFRQERLGKDGKVFSIYKFRTMKTEQYDKNGRELTDFERITPLGKFIREWSIDELPQLINILKGEMSLIGPRPLLSDYLTYYTSKQMRRHEVLPGVTGWAQVNGRNTVSWEEKFDCDVWYVDNISILLDLKIVYLTIIKIFKREGVNQNNTATMERFDQYVLKQVEK